MFWLVDFSGEDFKWLARVTVRLQVSNYSQLSDYNFADKIEQIQFMRQ